MIGHTKLVAEIADNHGGDMALAKHMIKTLAGIGVDIVKFQSWQMRRVRDPKAEPFYQWLVKAELSDEQHLELMETCRQHGVQFLTTVFDIHRIEFLAELKLPSIKISSPDTSNSALLRAVRENFPHAIISTGMHTADEVRAAAEIMNGANYTFMHCVSIYPHELHQVNFSRILWLRQFTPSVGFSDHSGGIEAAKMAMLLGVDYIERHFAMSKYGPGRVNPWDTFPEQWEELVAYREAVRVAWGEGAEVPLSEEELTARKRFIGRWSGGQ